MDSIHIIYSQKENVAYCMWKYFFDSCGIWVISQTIEEYENSLKEKGDIQEKKGESTLYILSEDERQWIRSNEQQQVAYYVSLNLWNQYPNKERKDVIPIVWDKKESRILYKSLLQILSDDVNVAHYLMCWFDLFSKYESWGYTWLFQTINLKDKTVWDQQIYEMCRKLIENLEEMGDEFSKNKYLDFSTIYYSYIRDSIIDKDSNNQIDNIADLLYMCKNYLNKYGDNPALYWMMGKICGLTSSERKTVVLFYHNIEEENYTPELLYAIGREYEKNYRDEKKAYSYFLQSYKMNKNYKALYKVAVRFNEHDDWQSALSLYEMILNDVRRKYRYDSITINDIEYEYKVIIRIAEIYKKYVKAYDMAEGAIDYLQDLYKKLETRKDFDNLLNKMFDKNALRIRHELWEEIRKKFQTPFFSNSVL